MTAPHIGNTGMNTQDEESRKIWVSGFVVRNPSPRVSNWRSERSLEDDLISNGVVGIKGIDTRALTLHLRERGAMRVGIFSGNELSREEMVVKVRSAPEMAGAFLAEEVTVDKVEIIPVVGERRFKVAAIDLGIKSATPRNMAARGIEVHLMPATITFEEVKAGGFDGLFLSNGPGDPATMNGHQILGRALGFDTYKLRFGHRGINQPVLNVESNKVEITAQNHGFAVEAPLDGIFSTVYGPGMVTHICLNDSVVEGLKLLDKPAFSVQYHPEAAAGPHDANYLFDQFLEMLGKHASR
jgi:carbamoyl-phosphate synthase small subunit